MSSISTNRDIYRLQRLEESGINMLLRVVGTEPLYLPWRPRLGIQLPDP